MAAQASLPALPHWEQPPDDLPDAVQADQGGAARPHRGLGAHGRGGLRGRRAAGRDRGRRDRRGEGARRDGLAGHRLRGHRGRYRPRDRAGLLHRRGCLVVRGHFEREQALAWDRGIVDYVESNRFFENYRGPGDDFFGSVGLQAGDLPDLLVAGPDAGPPERPDGAGPGVPQRSVDQTSPAVSGGSIRAATRCTRTASAAARPAPTPRAWAPTSTPARSTCG